MMKKYELMKDDNICVSGKTLYRIRALVNFDRVRAGDIGGYVEGEHNLSNAGNAWICGDAQVFENARVSDNALVCDHARIFGNADVSGNTWIIDDARVYGNALASGNAIISDNAQIYGEAQAYDNARIYGDAQVFGEVLVRDDAQVYGSAQVCGDAWVYGKALVCGGAAISKTDHIVVVGPIGIRDDYTTFFRNNKNGITVTCGCFTGDIDQFLKWVSATHGDSKHAVVYKLAAELAQKQIALEAEE